VSNAAINVLFPLWLVCKLSTLFFTKYDTGSSLYRTPLLLFFLYSLIINVSTEHHLVLLVPAFPALSAGGSGLIKEISSLSLLLDAPSLDRT
jgi:hypothetical protein